MDFGVAWSLHKGVRENTIMKFSNLILGGAALFALGACGSNSTPAVSVSPYTTTAPVAPVPTTPGVQSSYGSYTTSIPGGSRTLTPVLRVDPYSGYQYAQLYNTYSFTETATVTAGDLIIVQAQAAVATHSGIISSTSLKNLTVNLNGSA